MAKHSTTFTATTGPSWVMAVHVPRDRQSWIGTAVISGSFGTNTNALCSVYLSGDGGTTTTALRTPDGRNVSTGAPFVFTPIEMGCRFDAKQPLEIYASLTPVAGSPSVTLDIYDNK